MQTLVGWFRMGGRIYSTVSGYEAFWTVAGSMGGSALSASKIMESGMP
ncbi:MAG TPA: hypothetical protein VKF82_06480 [Candidatus Eremiobacteraceae bacterium]|nr:hypothetical protein [Candidatus Eremiobacteraceae bacterium]